MMDAYHNRLVILVVVGTAFVGLLAGWAAGVVTEGVERVGTLGFLSAALFVLVVLVVTWLTLEERGKGTD